MKEIEQEFWELVDKDYGLNREGADRDVIIKHRKRIDEIYRRLAFQPGQNKSHFWVHCSAQTFKTHYKPRLQKYLFNHIDHTEIDFLKNEYLTISKFANTHQDVTLLSLESQQLDARFYYEKRKFLLNKLNAFNLMPIEKEEIDSDETGRKEVLTYTDWQFINVPQEEVRNEKIFIPTVYQKVLILNLMGVFEKLPLNNQGNLNQLIASNILALLTGHDKSNFRKHLSTLDKKESELTEKQKLDKTEILKKLKALGWV